MIKFGHPYSKEKDMMDIEEMKSYKDLKIYQIGMELSLEVHNVSMELPKFELYEIGSQVRRSSKSVVFNIVEGYGRRKYRNEYVKFLIYAHSSNLETLCQLQMISALYPKLEMVKGLIKQYDDLGAKLYRFIERLEFDR